MNHFLIMLLHWFPISKERQAENAVPGFLARKGLVLVKTFTGTFIAGLTAACGGGFIRCDLRQACRPVIE
jgi:hypothetical protein